jgi:TonB family protein
MKKHKPINLTNVIMVAVLLVIVMIPLVMSRAGKKVDSWTRVTDVEKTIKKLEGLESLEKLEALEGLPELQAELDSILRNIDIPELDSLTFIIPEVTIRENGKNRKQITISKTTSLPSYEMPPKIIGGYDAILEHLVYPEELKKAGIEGAVIVQAHVEKDGSVSKTHLLASSGHDSFDQTAMDALMKIKFEPVMRDGEAVDIWVALPVIFKLDNQ